ncbi:hypothetical protein D6C90_00399 [Aureobasidium pullulans]|uniref:Uncharacterized protein n=1 Tax=Aureobasidium pullulans TaxID=5580 RepID=A0A4S8Y581_AURPU|nr:hypothetical protein D6D22_03473 [Aureobasidium pullulans]THX95298.1 hypothetical protein D6D08_01286 [Aureobasidium pullulans]THY66405.1 hypothetical protein D6C97_01700 [Aureobasidium pullulans]THZ53765.1 hypothetical protein D6C90_00399 [Aureobasidium pullulans]CAC9889140.1 unnamed protein product [Aureobasidium pullulans]
MGWYSLLPTHLSDIEGWISSIFMSLGVVTIGPWALLLVYDLLFYVYRSCAYHIPFIGGKAQGKRRPRAPSLTERPSGQRRDAPKVPIPAATTGTHQHEEGLERRRTGNS